MVVTARAPRHSDSRAGCDGRGNSDVPGGIGCLPPASDRYGRALDDLAEGTVSSTGRYVVSFTPEAAGTLDLQVYVPASRNRAAGYSAVVRVQVAQGPAVGNRPPVRRQSVSLGIENIANPQDWDDLRSKVDRAHVNVLHLCAGRVEWTAFDSAAHPEVAAESGSDHLARAISELGTMPNGTPEAPTS